MKKLYYTVEKQLNQYGDVEETNGYKTITVYDVINNEIVNQFVNENFDLLISYYDVEKTPLLQITNLSKAHFKVGFATIDKRLNHFIIDTKPENYKVFF